MGVGETVLGLLTEAVQLYNNSTNDNNGDSKASWNVTKHDDANTIVVQEAHLELVASSVAETNQLLEALLDNPKTHYPFSTEVQARRDAGGQIPHPNVHLIANRMMSGALNAAQCATCRTWGHR